MVVRLEFLFPVPALACTIAPYLLLAALRNTAAVQPKRIGHLEYVFAWHVGDLLVGDNVIRYLCPRHHIVIPGLDVLYEPQ